MNPGPNDPLRPAFKPGQPVRVLDRSALGHCRTPFYLRGRPGTVAEVIGRRHNPEQLAYHRPGLPQRHLYRVHFSQSDLWDPYPGSTGDTLEADIFEHWLEPIP